MLISDLPMKLSDGIKGGDYSEHQFDHVIVDEFQDLTPAEQDLFFRLRAENGQFVALGDPRQSIYAFRGNDRMGLAKLNKHPLLGDATIHDCPMSECQRCPKELVNAANQLMTLSDAQPMTSTSGRSGTIKVLYWKTPESEAKGMAKLIAANIKKFPKGSHLAMVTRRRFGYRLRDEISQVNSRITIDLAFSESILESWPVREAFLFASLICDPDPATWRAWFAYRQPKDEDGENVSDRNAPAYLNFLTACNDQITENSVFQLAEESRTKNRGQGGSNIWDRAVRFKELRNAKKRTEFEPEKLMKSVFSAQLWPSFDPSETRMATDDLEILKSSALQYLADIAEEEPELSNTDRLQKVFRHLRYSIATKEPLSEGVEADLQITTLWGGKGLTADHVYVIGLCDEAIPGRKTPEYPGTDADFREEQRRLFYVTITRAKQTMILSRPKKIRPGDARRLKFPVEDSSGNYLDLEMSSFLRSIMKYLPAAQDGDSLSPAR